MSSSKFLRSGSVGMSVTGNTVEILHYPKTTIEKACDLIDGLQAKVKALEEKLRLDTETCMCMDCGKCMKTSEQSEHAKICQKPNLKRGE